MEKVLRECTFTPLSLNEQRITNGGFFGIDDVVVGIAIAAGTAIINDWDNFKRGLAGEPEQ